MNAKQFVVFPFGEGVTERVLFDFLKRKLNLRAPFQDFQSVGGKNNFSSKILEFLIGQLQPGVDIRVLAFRDVDENEKDDSIVKSFQNIITQLIPDFSGEHYQLKDGKDQEKKYPIYKWEYESDFKFQFMLHLANPPLNKYPEIEIKNKTTDGYILAVGLQETVLSQFASDISSDASHIGKLVRNEVPAVIRNSGVDFDEDKDFLAAYLVATRFWKVKRTDEKARLAKIILERGWKQHAKEGTKEILGSWIKALEVAIQ